MRPNRPSRLFWTSRLVRAAAFLFIFSVISFALFSGNLPPGSVSSAAALESGLAASTPTPPPTLKPLPTLPFPTLVIFPTIRPTVTPTLPPRPTATPTRILRPTATPTRIIIIGTLPIFIRTATPTPAQRSSPIPPAITRPSLTPTFAASAPASAPTLPPLGQISMGRLIEPRLTTLIRGTALNLLTGGSFAMPIFPDQLVAPTIVGTNASVEFIWIGGPNVDRYEVLILAANGTPIVKSARLEPEKICAALLCRAVVSWIPYSRLDFQWAITAFYSNGKAFRGLSQAFSIPPR